MHTNDATAEGLRLSLSELLVNAGAIARRMRETCDPDDPRRIGAEALLTRTSMAWTGLVPRYDDVSGERLAFDEGTLLVVAAVAYDLDLFVTANLAEAGLGAAHGDAVRAQSASRAEFDRSFRILLANARVGLPGPAFPAPAARQGAPVRRLMVVGGREAA